MQQNVRPIEKQQQQIYVTLPKNRSNRNDTSYLSMWERDICKLARLSSLGYHDSSPAALEPDRRARSKKIDDVSPIRVYPRETGDAKSFMTR